MNLYRQIEPDKWADTERLPTLDRTDAAEEALARFRAQWPAERCKTLRDAISGTPAERASANARLVERALAPKAGDSAADNAVRDLIDPIVKGVGK